MNNDVESGPPPRDESPLNGEKAGTPTCLDNGDSPNSLAPNRGGSKVVSCSMAAGSPSYDDPDRPQWDSQTKLEREFHYHHGNGAYAYTALKGRRADGQKVFLRGRKVHGLSELQDAKLAGETYRHADIDFYLKGTGNEPDLLYRLPELLKALAERPDDPVFICEGEKDVDRLWELHLIATTNPNGALNWKDEYNSTFEGRAVVVLIDNDQRGRERGALLLKSMGGAA